MTRKTKTYLIIIGGSLLLLIGVPAWFIFGPPRRLEISPETTGLTEPLTAAGQVNYVQAVSQMRSAGVTPANNAAVPLVLATWKSDALEPEAQEFLCRELGIPRPEQEGLDVDLWTPRYKQLLLEWASEKWGVDLGDETLYEFEPSFYLDEVRYCPWRRADYPPLATWIDENEALLELLHDMEPCETYYYPSPEFADPDAALISAAPLGSQALRRAARGLKFRAMMHVGEGDAPLAWRDLRMIFLFSRMQMKHGSLIELLISYAIQDVAQDGMRYLLDSGHCDRRLLDEMAQFFADFPPPIDCTQAIDKHERWEMLELGMRAETLNDLTIRDDLPGYPQLLALPYDRNALLRRIQQNYDAWIPLLQIDDPTKALPAAERHGDQTKADLQSWSESSAMAAALLSQSVRGVYAADLICDWALEGMINAKRPFFRVAAEQQLLRVAIQLTKYRAEQGEYPETLAAIADSLPPGDLLDIYAPGQPLRYERRADGGYLLYSLFENGVDDEGTSLYGDVFRGDWAPPGEHLMEAEAGIDLVVRFPLPGPPPLLKPKSKAELEAEFAEMFHHEGEDSAEDDEPTGKESAQ